MTAPASSRIAFTADSRPELVAQVARWLEHQGYDVTLRANEITVGELAKLLGRKLPGVSISLCRKSCPPFHAIRGASGRIIKLTPTDQLLNHLRT